MEGHWIKQATGLHEEKMLDMRHTCFRDPRVKVRTVTLSADEIFSNARYDSLVQYFIYLISRPNGDFYGL